jgi:hypothetical protein
LLLLQDYCLPLGVQLFAALLFRHHWRFLQANTCNYTLLQRNWAFSLIANSEGDDGPWSSFNIRVGTPEQNVRVLVSTTSPETMVVMSQYGCSTEVFGTVPTGCANSRGLMFSPNASKTWNSQGNYYINGNGVGFEANLDYTQAANFALETVGLGISGVGPILKNQTVAGFYNPSPFYL